ncbi:hypothetical protein L0F63_005714 [Massospora cicadina]|nr:hypothetical protein L0F63_005714 [Massospora cicadina]
MTCHPNGAVHFRFQLVACELVTCQDCNRHFITSKSGNEICPRCHNLIEIGLPLESTLIFDLERFLLTYGLFFAGCPTSLIFMRLRVPRRSSACEDAWSDVLVSVGDAALRIYELGTRLVASFTWSSLALHFLEPPDTGDCELVLKGRDAHYIIGARAPSSTRWLRACILTKLKLFSSRIVLDNSFTRFQLAEPVTKPVKLKSFLSRLRSGKFLRRREALMRVAPHPSLSRNPELPISIHRLASPSLPNVALNYALKGSSRFSTPSSINSSEESTSPPSNSELNLLFSSPFSGVDEVDSSNVHCHFGHPAGCPPATSTPKRACTGGTLLAVVQPPAASRPHLPTQLSHSAPPRTGSMPGLDSHATLPPMRNPEAAAHIKVAKAPRPQYSAPTLGSHALPRDLDRLLDRFPIPPNR